MKTNPPFEILKNLSIKECIGLAKYLYPQYQWFYHHNSPDALWDGHDVAAGNYHTFTGYKHTLRIDYRSDISSEQPRIIFRSNDGSTEICEESKVIAYLTNIGKLRLG